jgi:hypothetical protein
MVEKQGLVKSFRMRSYLEASESGHSIIQLGYMSIWTSIKDLRDWHASIGRGTIFGIELTIDIGNKIRLRDDAVLRHLLDLLGRGYLESLFRLDAHQDTMESRVSKRGQEGEKVLGRAEECPLHSFVREAEKLIYACFPKGLEFLGRDSIIDWLGVRGIPGLVRKARYRKIVLVKMSLIDTIPR